VSGELNKSFNSRTLAKAWYSAIKLKQAVSIDSDLSQKDSN
jgi:hypothetical protein